MPDVGVLGVIFPLSWLLIILFLQVNELKAQGNKAFQAKDYDAAIDLFTQAIALDPKNHVLWSNRSAAKAGKKQWADALADAEEVSGSRFYAI